MANLLTTLEEFDLAFKLQFPHFLFPGNDMESQARLAFEVLSRKEKDILLVVPDGFKSAGVLAGLSEKNVEYLALNAPQEYKVTLLKSLGDQEMRKNILAIAKMMDEDIKSGSVYNQERVKNIIQYVKDNQAVFQF